MKNLISLLVISISMTSTLYAAHVMTWVPPYGISNAKSNLQNNPHIGDGLTRIGLQFWTVNSSGGVSFVNNGGTASVSDIQWFTNWSANNEVTPLLTVVNLNGSPAWDWGIIENLLADPTAQSTLITNLVNTAKNYNLGGVDIDFETPNSDNQSEDRVNFQNFISALGSALQAEGLILTINTFAATYFAPNWSWWSGLTNSVDAIHSMGYEEIGYNCYSNSYCGYHNQINQAGDINKVMMGIPGNKDNWLSQSVNYHLNGAKTLGVGIAIWDVSILTNEWKTETIWSIIRDIKGSTLATSSSFATSSSSGSSSSTVDPDTDCNADWVSSYQATPRDTYFAGHSGNVQANFTVGDWVKIQGDECSCSQQIVNMDDWNMYFASSYECTLEGESLNIEKVTFVSHSSSAEGSSAEGSSVESSSTSDISSDLEVSSDTEVSSSSDLYSSSTEVEPSVGIVLSDFAYARAFDGHASSAGGNFKNGFWEAFDDQTSPGGSSLIEAYHAETSSWFKLNKGLVTEECPYGDDNGDGESDCYWGWNYQDAIFDNQLNTRFTISDYINATGWGWANAGWWYFFDYDPTTEDISTAKTVGLSGASTFYITATIPAGKQISVMLYESNYASENSATGSRPTLKILGTGSEKTYFLQIQNFEPTWGTHETDIDKIIGLGFLRVEGASREGEAIGMNAGSWEMGIRKLCLDSDCRGAEDMTVKINPERHASPSFDISRVDQFGVIIQSHSNQNYQVQLLNSTGQVLESQRGQGQINWSQSLNTGIYFMRVYNGSEIQSSRVIIP